MRHGPQEASNESSAWQGAAPLTLEGNELVERVVRVHCEGKHFSLFWTSPLVRCKQTATTAYSIIETTPLLPPSDVPRYVMDIPELGPIEEKAWDYVFRLHPEYASKMYDTKYMFACESALFIIEGNKTLGAIRRAAAVLDDGTKGFLVSHQPFIELALAAAYGKWPTEEGYEGMSPEKGEIIVFQFEGDTFVGWRHLKLP